MIKILFFLLSFTFCLFPFSSYVHADFDERYWEMYAEIYIPAEGQLPQLGGISLEPWLSGISGTRTYLSDLRILTEKKVEVPYQIVTRNPETKTEELLVKMLNLSLTQQNETYFMGYIENPHVIYNEIDILTGDENFYRQVQVLGSMDGKGWNLIRGDAVIFSYHREETIRHTKITFSDSNYRYISIRIMNNNEKPLKIAGLKIFYKKTAPGIEMPLNVWISKKEDDNKKRESIVFINLYSNFPARKINLVTPDKNFQRKVEVFVKQGGKEWERYTDGVIFNFDTAKIKESNLAINIPEAFTKEIKLVIKNYDSPPINITGVSSSGYRKDLIFKLDGWQKYYLFWGNPQAKTPQYDISELIARHGIKDIRIFRLEIQKKNPKFTSPEKRLPFTERYKYLLYGVVTIVILGLILLQYFVIKRTDKKSDKG